MNRAFSTFRKQPWLVSTLLVGGVVLLGLTLHNWVGYRVVAFMLLVSVSLLALVYSIRTVITAAVVSALLWDYLFIPPRFTLTIGSTEDQLLLLTYFLVALIHAVLTRRVRQAEERARQKEVKAGQIRFYNTLLSS